jgi:hypothetical protein
MKYKVKKYSKYVHSAGDYEYIPSINEPVFYSEESARKFAREQFSQFGDTYYDYRIEEIPLYGFYSEKQAEVSGSVIYKDLNGNNVEVTEVGESPVSSSKWDDITCMGRVTNYVCRSREGSLIWEDKIRGIRYYE